MRIKRSSAFTDIKLDEASKKVPNRVQVLRVGKFNHPEYGFFEITPQTLAEMKQNFDARTRGIDICFDYYHDSEKDAAAWVKQLSLEDDGTTLWAEVDWTEPAAQKLAHRELRYFSPDFASQWTDPESGKKYRNVLFGGGLTNRPFVKEMSPIVAHEKEGKEMKTELEQLRDQVKTLSEEKTALEQKLASVPAPSEGTGDEKAKQIADLKAEIAALQTKLQALEGEKQTLAAEKEKAEADKKLSDKKAKFTKMLSEGKAVKAQEQAFLEGDMDKFAELAEPLNLGGRGTSEGSREGEGAKDQDEKIMDLANKKLSEKKASSMGEAISLARKELKITN